MAFRKASSRVSPELPRNLKVLEFEKGPKHRLATKAAAPFLFGPPKGQGSYETLSPPVLGLLFPLEASMYVLLLKSFASKPARRLQSSFSLDDVVGATFHGPSVDGGLLFSSHSQVF